MDASRPSSLDPAGSRIPERVGRYDLLLPIASGGMASVYLARLRGHGGFEQDVALKLTHAHLRETPEFITDLVEEAKLASRIRHRNVVSVVDVGDDPLGVFLVMEYIEGDTLGGLRRRANGIPTPIAARILVDALAGLQAAHELSDDEGRPLGLVHRDFSPQNILVGTDGVARLTDFGIAKAEGRASQTSTGIVKGKAGYLAPEQARGEAVDRTADVWAAGVVAWEVLANRRLYPSQEAGIIFRVATETPPRLRTVAPAVASAVDEAVAHALTPDRAKRTQTAVAFSKELVAAFRQTGQIADHDEVAEFVKHTVGSKLAERRVAAAEVKRLRAEMGAVVSTIGRFSPVTPTPSQAPVIAPPAENVSAVGTTERSPQESRLARPDSTDATQELNPDAPFTDTNASAPRRAARRRAAAATLVALASLAIAFALWLHARSPSPPSSAAPAVTDNVAPSTLPSDQASTAPAVSAPPTVPAVSAPPAPADAASPVTLTVTANVPIASLSIDGADIAVARPSKQIDASLASPLADGVQVRAVAIDGRRASARLTRGATSITIAFGVHSSARPGATTAAPPLGPDPYHHRPR
jgi:serine/threonine-protein kinase